MRSVSIAAVLLVMAAPALGADPVLAPVGVVEADPAGDWSGPYIGLHGGYIFGSVASNIPALPFDYSTSPAGFTGGVFAGYQLQHGQVVFGVEGDLGFAAAKDSFTDGITIATDEILWTGSLRGRVGIALDRLMPFLTAGVGVAGVRSTDDFVGGGSFQSIDKMMVGYVVGAGVDAKVTEKLTARVEVLYSNYGTQEFAFTPPLFVTDKSYSAVTVRGGLSWQF